MTRLLRGHDIEKEDLDYRPVIDTHPINMTQTRRLDVAYRPVHTFPKHYSWDDRITAHMYGLQMLQFIVGGRPTVRYKIHVVELDYLLGHHARSLLWIGAYFIEPVDDDVSIDKERQMSDSYLKSKKENVVD